MQYAREVVGVLFRELSSFQRCLYSYKWLCIYIQTATLMHKTKDCHCFAH